MAAKKKAPAPNNPRTPAVPPRGTEVTLVADFPRPKAWLGRGSRAGDRIEIDLMKAKQWHPTTDDFMVVANVPNQGKKRTEIFNVRTVGEMLGAILDLGKDGKPKRKKGSIKRLNLISHGTPLPGNLAGMLYGLSGTIKDDGACFINSAVIERDDDPNAPMTGGGMDLTTIDWLNTTARSIRDDCRACFREDGEIGLILCNGGGSPFSVLSQQMIKKMATTFNVLARGFDDEVIYENDFDDAKSKLFNRDQTRINAPGKLGGVGYFCAVDVPKALAGEHLKFTHDEPKPKTAP